MIGAIIGDIVGSRFEFDNHRSMEFALFTEDCFVTDDSIMTLAVAKAITGISHNHEEGIKGAEATAIAAYLARTGHDKEQIRTYIEAHYYVLDFTLDEIRKTYEFNETCQETVPQAIQAFLESESFEDAIRKAISIGGDSDTLAAITGGIAEAYYGVPEELVDEALSYLAGMLV